MPASLAAISVCRSAGEPQHRHALLPRLGVRRWQYADFAVLQETPLRWIDPLADRLGPQAPLCITRFGFDVAEFRIIHVPPIRPGMAVTQHGLVEVAAL